ncbi:MAG: oxalurate catabolism protein HpxZ [Proteobacteria bacterium]|nr:oxalurate catabolism protein HpxZ [Pseudomonadota bacterium]
MVIDDPEVVAEVRAAFERYERALTTNDTAVLDELFWDSPRTIRYGINENLYGIEEIRAFRSAREPVDLMRDLARTEIHTYGRDYATASTLYRRRGSGRTGRQMQTWLRTPAGWRIVAAHVSFLEFDFPAAS